MVPSSQTAKVGPSLGSEGIKDQVSTEGWQLRSDRNSTDKSAFSAFSS
ncbi:MAG: hypothetical protein WBL95_04445 [Microcoleus sp.]